MHVLQQPLQVVLQQLVLRAHHAERLLLLGERARAGALRADRPLGLLLRLPQLLDQVGLPVERGEFLSLGPA